MLRYTLILSAFSVYSVICVFNPGPKYPPTKGEVWPKPQHQRKDVVFFKFSPSQFSVKVTNQDCTIVSKAVNRLCALIGCSNLTRWRRRRILREKGRDVSTVSSLKEEYVNHTETIKELQIDLTQPCELYPYYDMDESYNITVSTTSVLRSHSVWGVLRGLETFSQLFYQNDDYNELRINATTIVDYPRYAHRGLLLDTGRHYVRLENILKTLDAMAMNKMNVFHWHIVDDQSFPYQSTKFPELSEKGAFHPSMVYTKQDVQMIIGYARDRGIRVVPEFDVPGHTRSWGEAYPNILAKCFDNSNNFMGLGPMNPVWRNVYIFLRDFFQEVQELFPDRYLHLGGDEVEMSCWESNPKIKEYMWKHNISKIAKMHSIFMKNTMAQLANGSKVIVWQEVFDEKVPLPKDTLIQVWNWNWVDEMIKVLSSGHKVVFSSSWYLNILKDTFTTLYAADPRRMVYDAMHNNTLCQNIVGGEACLWGEMADDTNILSRTWPRASAVAEVLWSKGHPTSDVPLDVYHRIEEHTCRMIRRGIPAEPPNGPGFCLLPSHLTKQNM